MRHKILTVDDSRTIRMIVKKAFQAYECELFEAENGKQGLELAAEKKPDLIVLDITMPVMTGIEMLGKLFEDESLKNTPVIMLTAESGKDHIMNIVKMGVKDYIVKPFKGEQLIERAKLILDLIPRIDAADDTESNETSGLFSAQGGVVIMTLPEKITRKVGNQAEEALKSKISQMTSAGARRFILNLSAIANLNMTAIQVILSVVNSCVRSKLQAHLVATENQTESLKGFRETADLPTMLSIEEAKQRF